MNKYKTKYFITASGFFLKVTRTAGGNSGFKEDLIFMFNFSALSGVFYTLEWNLIIREERTFLLDFYFIGREISGLRQFFKMESYIFKTSYTILSIQSIKKYVELNFRVKNYQISRINSV